MRDGIPKVSVIIPTFNRAGLVARAVESALHQSYERVEVIVVDDGSTDNTPELLSKYANQIRYVSLSHGERARARNYGVEIATGDFVAFLDADDRWLPGKLADQIAFLLQKPDYDWCFCQAWVVDAQGNQLSLMDGKPPHTPSSQGGDLFHDLLFGCFVPSPSSVLAPRDVLLAVGGFEEGMTSGEDWHLWLKMALNFPGILLARPLVLYQSDESLVASSYVRYNFGLNAPRMLQNLFRQIPADRCDLTTQAQALGHAYWVAALSDYAVGRRSEGRQNLILALAAFPDWRSSSDYLLDSLAGFANHLYRDRATPLNDSLALAQQVATDLPGSNCHWVTEAMARIYAARAFESYRQNEKTRHGVSVYAIQALRYSFSMRRNLGLWSILLEALAGSRVANWARYVGRAVYRWLPRQRVQAKEQAK